MTILRQILIQDYILNLIFYEKIFPLLGNTHDTSDKESSFFGNVSCSEQTFFDAQSNEDMKKISGVIRRQFSLKIPVWMHYQRKDYPSVFAETV